MSMARGPSRGSVSAFGYLATVLWNPVSKLGNVASLGLLSLTAMWIYFYVTKWLEMPETAYFERALARLNRKAKSPKEDEQE